MKKRKPEPKTLHLKIVESENGDTYMVGDDVETRRPAPYFVTIVSDTVYGQPEKDEDVEIHIRIRSGGMLGAPHILPGKVDLQACKEIIKEFVRNRRGTERHSESDPKNDHSRP